MSGGETKTEVAVGSQAPSVALEASPSFTLNQRMLRPAVVGDEVIARHKSHAGAYSLESETARCKVRTSSSNTWTRSYSRPEALLIETRGLR